MYRLSLAAGETLLEQLTDPLDQSMIIKEYLPPRSSLEAIVST